MLTGKNIYVRKNAVSAILEVRWIACYMLLDWQIDQANFAIECNEQDRFQRVAEKLGDNFLLDDEISQTITELYNKVLLEDTESFVHRHMATLQKNRAEIEYEIVKTIAEIYKI